MALEESFWGRDLSILIQWPQKHIAYYFEENLKSSFAQALGKKCIHLTYMASGL